MKIKNTKYFALDIGNVCMHVHTERCLAALGYSAITEVPLEFMSACDKFETGRISTDDWMAVFRKITGGRFTDAELVNAWRVILGDEIPGIYSFLDEITRAGHRVIFFSDTSELHLDFVYRYLPSAIFVTGGIFSFKAGCKKPAAGMYEAFEKTYGVPCFYTDDKLENIEAGLKRGWPSHQFTSVENLRKAFLK
jgi:FMN phosphatase YigB (HAD superfamily)